jgi:hypothetical protein
MLADVSGEIGGSIKCFVVQENQCTVTGAVDIHLNHVDAALEAQIDAAQRILRNVAPPARAVRHDEWHSLETLHSKIAAVSRTG